jgi:polyisoprenyl-phosphate glycosyltransferase
MVDAADPGQHVALSVVVPCLNEESGIPELIRRCVQSAAEAVGPEQYEIILIDDGSSDRTWHVISEQIEHNRHIVGIKLSRNFGHQIALTAGLSAVQGKLVLVLDADLQDPPELLRAMMATMEAESADVVYGQRRSRDGESWFKTKSAGLFYRMLQRSADVAIPLNAGDFRLMTRRIADLIAQMPERDRFIRGMVAMVGFRQVPFLYDRQQRFAGETKYPFAKMLTFALDAFLGYSMVPIRLLSFSAVLLLVALMGVAGYALAVWYRGEVVPGWTSLMLAILVISFFQLASLSIIGEYVGRIYLSSKNRPLFIIDAIKRNG